MGYAGAVRPGIWNLVFGLVFVGLGLSRHFTLFGTDSPTLLVGAGAVLALFGVVQLARSRPR
jgi:hypothetical protein